jgi:hypothetical protein
VLWVLWSWTRELPKATEVGQEEGALHDSLRRGPWSRTLWPKSDGIRNLNLRGKNQKLYSPESPFWPQFKNRRFRFCHRSQEGAALDNGGDRCLQVHDEEQGGDIQEAKETKTIAILSGARVSSISSWGDGLDSNLLYSPLEEEGPPLFY